MQIFINTVLHFLIGIGGGIVSSAPLGPTDFWIARRVLASRHPKIVHFILGVVLCDLLYAFVAFWGYFGFLKRMGLIRAFSILGAIAIIGMGIHGIWTQKKKPSFEDQTHPDRKKTSPAADFVTGFLICGFNPAFIFFWVFVAATLFKFGWEPGILSSLVVFAGIALGDVLWYVFFAKIVRAGSGRLHPHLIDKLQLGINIGIIICGIIGLYEIIKHPF